jgi:N6-adenosine-specific RNA methylase IME4
MTKPFPNKKYNIIYADPPWSYYGDPNKNAAAGKHYNLMSQDELAALPVKSIAEKNCWLFMWATPARLHYATEMIQEWGFHYRNIAYVWEKTKADGNLISDRGGIRPTYTKTAWLELLLVATSKTTGRMTKLNSEAHPSRIYAKREEHSKKPQIFRDLIVQQLGDIPRIELFARNKDNGWDVWGNQI